MKSLYYANSKYKPSLGFRKALNLIIDLSEACSTKQEHSLAFVKIPYTLNRNVQESSQASTLFKIEQVSGLHANPNR